MFQSVLFATFVVAIASVPVHEQAVSHVSITHHIPSHTVHEAPSLFTYHTPQVHTYTPVISKIDVAPVHQKEEHHGPVYYKFEYSVHDPHTHDIKEQKEERHGDVVKGYYSLIEPDGTKRVVEYTADKHNGFNAVVHREHSHHPEPIKKSYPEKESHVPVVKIAEVPAPVHYVLKHY